MNERPIASVPRPVLALLAAGLAAQVAWHGAQPPPAPRAEDLPAPPARDLLAIAALGEPEVASRLLMIWLQAFDNQPGVSIPFTRLDYDRVEAWLDAALALDPRTEYPLLAAARLYAAVPDDARRRQMLEWVYERFLEDPNRRWRWLAQAAITAKHRLGDLELALRYARALNEHATGPAVPAWARDMAVSVLEDMGEQEAAMILVGELLDSGRVTDPNEIRFLVRKLEELQAGPGGEPAPGGPAPAGAAPE